MLSTPIWGFFCILRRGSVFAALNRYRHSLFIDSHDDAMGC